MDFKIKPYAHQMKALELATKMPNIGLFWEMGCLAGDTEVTINRGGCSRRYRIQDLYRKWSKNSLKNNERGLDTSRETHTRAMTGACIRKHRILDVLYSGKKEVFILKTATKSIKTTIDHKIYTQRGWVPCGQLSTDDYIATDSGVFKKGERSEIIKPRYNVSKIGNHYPYGHVTTSKGNKIHREFIHILTCQARLNSLPLETFIQGTFTRNNFIFKDTSKYHCHHKNMDHKDNSPDNLEFLTAKEHLFLHGKYEHFGHGSIRWEKFVSRCHVGVEDTYDISCEAPHHNFVANGIVVHNSGKSGAAVNILRLRCAAEKRLLRTLIVSPLVTLYNWEREIKMHSKINASDIIVLSGGTKKILQGIMAACYDETQGILFKSKILVINYEGVRSPQILEALRQWQPEMMIIDECQRIKSHKASQSKAVVSLGESAKYKLMLSGTPILNKPFDIYNQFRFLDNGATFGKNPTVFMATYMIDANASWSQSPSHFAKFELNPKKADELTELISRKCYRISKTEALPDLPPLIKKEILLDMSPDMRQHYDKMVVDFITYVEHEKTLKNHAVVAQTAMTKALRLLQIASGVLADQDGVIIQIKDNPKLKIVKELLEEICVENNNKIILWCCFVPNYEQLAIVCRELKLEPVFITGQQDLEEKQAAMDKFNDDPECKVIICNRRAGGVGINLVKAKYSLVYSRNFSLEDELQSEARNHRGGSQIHDSIVKIDLVYKNSIEQYTVEMLNKKFNIAEKILDLSQEILYSGTHTQGDLKWN